MARKLARRAGAPQAVLAWAVLVFILIWLFVNWPNDAERRVTEVSSTGSSEATETTSTGGSQPDTRAEVVTESLNFRSDPVPEDRNIIQSLRRGTRIKILEKREGWLFVELGTGQSGWIVDTPDLVKIIE